MNPHWRFAPALWCVILLASLPVFAEAQWTEIHSPNFDIITDGGQRQGRETALRFEQMRAAFGHIFAVKVSTPIPLQIVAFRSSKELRRVAPLWKGKPIELAGVYIPGEDRQFIALDLTSGAGYEVAFHEYTHLLLRSTLGELPIWLNEGLADYLSTIKVNKNQIIYGNPPIGRGDILFNSRWMTIEQLFAVQSNSPEYNERGDHRSMLYAESWIVVHYLMTKNTLNNALHYRELVQDRHVSIPDAIQQAFGMTGAELQKTLEAYARRGLPTWSVPGAEVASEDSYTAQPISEINSEAIIADLHLHEPDYTQQAITEFQQVLQKQPDNAIAHRGLGYALLRTGDYSGAEVHLKAAVTGNAADARTHYLYALLLTRKGFAGQQSVMLSSTEDIDVAELKKQAQAAITLDPNFADAYNLLAYAQAREKDFQAALQSETKAFRLDQHKDIYILNLAGYQAQLHNFDEAERLLKSLANNPDEMVVSNAQKYLQMIQTQRNFEAAQHARAGSPPPMESFQPNTATDSTSNIPAPPPGSIQFLKGKIVKVDCSNAPKATVGVIVGSKLWAMNTTDRNKLILIGADTFSCDWRNRSVAVNFRPTAENAGDIVSLELQ